MSNRAYLPRAQAAIVGAQGIPTTEFYDFLLRLAAGTEDANLQAQILALAARVAALEAEGGDIGNIQGLNSILTFGNLNDGTVTITLAGDDLSPAATYYYGTNAAGEKGWHAVADTIEAATDELTKAVATDGVTTFGLADVPDAGGGTLQKTDFDAKGRKTGTSAATTDDLTEGVTNLYFTAQRVRDTLLTGLSVATNAAITAADTVLSALGKLQAQITALAATVSGLIVQTITDGDTTHAPSGDAVFDALATKEPTIAAGTTAQLLRGDKTWANNILGNFGVGTESPAVVGNGRELTVSSPDANTLARLNLQGNNSNTAANIASFAAYNGTNIVAQLTVGLNGAADSGIFRITTRTTGAPNVATRLQIDSVGAIYPGADNSQQFGSSSTRWSEIYSSTFRPGTGAPIWTSGSGTPEGAITAPVGSLYTRTNGGAGTTLYIKESGAGSVGWRAV